MKYGKKTMDLGGKIHKSWYPLSWMVKIKFDSSEIFIEPLDNVKFWHDKNDHDPIWIS